MTRIEALIDTNVIVAACAQGHQHHEPSAEMLEGRGRERFGVAAHSFAEAYNTLTRRGDAAPYRWTADEAAAALDVIRSITVLVGLTPAQTFDAVRDYAAHGGIGARVYDKLIGQAAVQHGIAAIVTWNARHMRSLFPALDVRTPAEWKETPR